MPGVVAVPRGVGAAGAVVVVPRAVGVVAGSSVLGMLIPPSVMLIIYALITEQSVADLFRAGIMPGIVLSLAYTVAIITMAYVFPDYIGGQDEASKAAQSEQATMSLKELLAKTAPFVILILLVLGGIYETELRETITKVPLLGDIPAIGFLFRRKQVVHNKAELLIFVTPRILKQGSSIY